MRQWTNTLRACPTIGCADQALEWLKTTPKLGRERMHIVIQERKKRNKVIQRSAVGTLLQQFSIQNNPLISAPLKTHQLVTAFGKLNLSSEQVRSIDRRFVSRLRSDSCALKVCLDPPKPVFENALPTRTPPLPCAQPKRGRVG